MRVTWKTIWSYFHFHVYVYAPDFQYTFNELLFFFRFRPDSIILFYALGTVQSNNSHLNAVLQFSIPATQWWNGSIEIFYKTLESSFFFKMYGKWVSLKFIARKTLFSHNITLFQKFVQLIRFGPVRLHRSTNCWFINVNRCANIHSTNLFIKSI